MGTDGMRRDRMKALVKTGPHAGLEWIDVERPRPGARDVILQVEAGGVCGTDHHIYEWNAWAAHRVHPPVIVGHEFVGTVVEVGADVRSVSVGERVSAEGHLYCGRCFRCRTGLQHVCEFGQIMGVDVNGGHAEFAAVPEQNIWKIPPEIPLEIAAILDPIGNAVHVALSTPVAGATVAIVGCGPIGCIASTLARALGAHAIVGIDVNEFRLSLAQTMGATHVVRSGPEDPVERMREISRGRGADVVWEMSGHPTAIGQAFDMLRPGGEIVLFGLPADPVPIDLAGAIIFRSATVRGVNGRKIFTTWYAAEDLLTSGRVDVRPVITHRRRFGDIDEVMQLMGSGTAGKILLRP